MDEFEFGEEVEEFDFSGVDVDDGQTFDLSVDLEFSDTQVELFEVSGDGGNVAIYTGTIGDIEVDAWDGGSSVSGTIEVLIP